jgi:hypothetical protein
MKLFSRKRSSATSGVVKLPGKIIEESKPVYPIISLLIIAAVEKPGDSSIRRLVKGSAGPFRALQPSHTATK